MKWNKSVAKGTVVWYYFFEMEYKCSIITPQAVKKEVIKMRKDIFDVPIKGQILQKIFDMDDSYFVKRPGKQTFTFTVRFRDNDFSEFRCKHECSSVYSDYSPIPDEI